MKTTILSAASILVLVTGPLKAQAPSTAESPAPAPAKPAPALVGSGDKSGAAGGDGSKFLGKDVPVFNPSSEIFTWDGKSWNVNDNRLFRARLEKYLNAPELTAKDDLEYQKILTQIMGLLAPDRSRGADVDAAWRLLSKAAIYRDDANLCDSLADAVYVVWQGKNEQTRIDQANLSLEKERESIEWNSSLSQEETLSDQAPKDKAGQSEWLASQKEKRTLRLQPFVKRLAEVEANIKKNQLRREVSEIQAKVEFQALIFQLFMQRRFQHVVIGTRFYRHIFGDGDSLLRVEGEAKKFMSKTSGLPATVGVLDSLANEAMRDVKEGVEAYQFLLEKNEMTSATQRLGETFVLGEYMPDIRMLPRDKKRRALEFTQKTNQLISALEVKDYDLARKLVDDLKDSAKDFDNSKPMAAIETARTISAMHLAKAKNAAVSGDRVTLENELKSATEIWPRNPALAEVSGLIFSQADVQQQAIVDFDRLLTQKNYRQIFDDKVRYIAATALLPDKQKQLSEVLDKIQRVETAILRASEVSKRGDYAGAWESVEREFQNFPNDVKLNQLRADLTTQAADFVRNLRTAQEMEQKDQTGSSLAWFLKAQQTYPASEFAKEGIDRMIKKVLPENEAAAGNS
jgi:hypothetical protein